jgi:hypothetical protein
MALDGCEWSAPFPGGFTFGKQFSHALNKTLGGSQNQSGLSDNVLLQDKVKENFKPFLLYLRTKEIYQM